jgi:hypothetical protein
MLGAADLDEIHEQGKNLFSPKVSIVIPVYNGSDYLREAIDSALSQTYRNIEVIVVNDGSVDKGKTRRIALSYGDRILYYEKENGGVATALNFAIDHMTGAYFSWLSHDDEYYPHKIETQICYLHRLQTEGVVLFSDFEEIDEKSRHVRHVRSDHEMLEKKPFYALLRGCINGCSLLIPRACFEIVGQFDQRLKTTQDYALWHKMIRRFEFIHIPEILVKYRIHGQQRSSLVRDIAEKEGNALWIDMMESLSDEDRTAYEGTSFQFYQKMAEHLSRSCYGDAFRFALGQAEKSLSASIQNRKVSVVIPFHNRIPWTLEALQSALDQTYPNFEVILVDDGSTEDISLLAEVCDRDPRITYVHQDHRGAAAARNRGIAEAKGEYIAFLDSDDLYVPEKLDVQVRALELSASYGMVYSQALGFDSNSNETVESWEGFLSGSIYPDLLFVRNNHITTPTVMIRTDVLRSTGLFDESMAICEDLDLWRKIARRHEILQISKPLAKIRVQHGRFDFKKNMRARILYYDKAFSEDGQLPLSLKTSLLAELYRTYARVPLAYRPWSYGVLYTIASELYALKSIYHESFDQDRLMPVLFVRRAVRAILLVGSRLVTKSVPVSVRCSRGFRRLIDHKKRTDSHGVT